jgi:NAD(P)-dependent dehydrogenase (short-subunit alcohol dehydrogenase family)
MRVQGKTAVITGATSGIGRSAAFELARQGADLALLCRSKSKGEQTQGQIESEVGRDCVRLFEADLESLDDVRRVAGQLNQELPKIDVLLNNAGVTLMRREETADGFEKTFAVNHLAPFLLTQSLLPKILETPGARIVNVASGAHRFARFDLDDLQSKKKYASMRVYGASKLANILYTNELARRLEDKDIRVWSLHPGAVATQLGANNGGFAKILLPVLALFFKTADQGAETSIYLCAEPGLDAPNGSYFENKKVARTSALARDRKAAERLWQESERMVGLS